jgi:hypothetical protein
MKQQRIIAHETHELDEKRNLFKGFRLFRGQIFFTFDNWKLG